MTSSPETVARPRRLAYVTATIFSDRTMPEHWTRYFGVVPTSYVIKGERFTTPVGKLSSGRGNANIWMYSSADIITDDVLSPHFIYLISKLGLPRPDLKLKLEVNQSKFRLSCYWANFSKDRTPVVEPPIKKTIEESGGVVMIDEYPNPHVSLDPWT